MIPRRDRLIIAFIVATLAASIVATISTANYLQFYTALSQLKLGMTSFQYTVDNRTLQAVVTFRIENPTSYRGLALRALAGDLEIQAFNRSRVSPQGSLPPAVAKGPLSPNAGLTVTIPFKATPEGTRIAKEAADRASPVNFVFSIDLVLETFLDVATEVNATYVCETNGEARFCEQASITLATKREQGSVGGGGGV